MSSMNQKTCDPHMMGGRRSKLNKLSKVGSDQAMANVKMVQLEMFIFLIICKINTSTYIFI